MYDAKIDVDNALLEIAYQNVTVSSAFPKVGASMPHISFSEGGNSDPLKPNSTRGILSDIDILIDVWHNRATDTLADLVNEKMNSIGFRRTFAKDLGDPSGLNRKTMRYRGVVDSRSNRVHQ